MEASQRPPGAALLETLIREHRDELLAFVRRRAGHIVDPDDVLQQAALRALSALDQLRNPARGRAWLFRIVRNVLANELRGLGLPVTQPFDSDVAAPPTEPSDACRCALELARTLKPEYKDILERVVIEDAPVTSLAATRALRKHLSPRLPELRLRRARLLRRLSRAGRRVAGARRWASNAQHERETDPSEVGLVVTSDDGSGGSLAGGELLALALKRRPSDPQNAGGLGDVAHTRDHEVDVVPLDVVERWQTFGRGDHDPRLGILHLAHGDFGGLGWPPQDLTPLPAAVPWGGGTVAQPAHRPLAIAGVDETRPPALLLPALSRDEVIECVPRRNLPPESEDRFE
jgi:RNA polymerase sigma-70 factor (ECF subfamily)